MISAFDTVENFVRKGENAGNQINTATKVKRKAFSPFPTMFSKGISLRVVKSWDCVVMS